MRHLELVSNRTEDTSAAAPGEKVILPEAKDDAPRLLFNEQFGIRLGGTTYYMNLRIGTEMRSQERLAADGQVPVSGLAFIYCVICSGAIMLFGTLCILYLLKSGMGINISDGHSVLHPLYEVIFGG